MGGLWMPELAPGPWSGLERLPLRPREFSFVLLSDRTGQARPGVFERGVEVVNLLRPDFVIQIGDTIEGYTTDAVELERQWAELDAITGTLEVPLFRTPGNHDVSNAVMREKWLRRHGALHHHFRHRDVLFVVLDTQDPPQTFDEIMMGSSEGHPADWNGTMPANLGEEQVAWAEQVIADHADVRWTVLVMHIPAWQGDGHPGLTRIRRALGARPYTAFAGHVHNYRRMVVDGREHIRLGPTGGVWVVEGDEGNFDHVLWATVSDGGLRIANLVLDGVLGAEGGAFRSPST